MRLLSATLTVLLLGSAACGSSDATGPSTNKLANGSMSAKINGSNWTATASVHASNTGSIVGIAGTDISQTLAFAVAAPGPGTYQLGALSPTNVELSTTGGVVWTAGGNLGGGTITITSLTATEVAGSFAFTLVRNGGGATMAVTNGAFDIKF